MGSRKSGQQSVKSHIDTRHGKNKRRIAKRNKLLQQTQELDNENDNHEILSDSDSAHVDGTSTPDSCARATGKSAREEPENTITYSESENRAQTQTHTNADNNVLAESGYSDAQTVSSRRGSHIHVHARTKREAGSSDTQTEPIHDVLQATHVAVREEIRNESVYTDEFEREKSRQGPMNDGGIQIHYEESKHDRFSSQINHEKPHHEPLNDGASQSLSHDTSQSLSRDAGQSHSEQHDDIQAYNNGDSEYPHTNKKKKERGENKKDIKTLANNKSHPAWMSPKALSKNVETKPRTPKSNSRIRRGYGDDGKDCEVNVVQD